MVRLATTMCEATAHWPKHFGRQQLGFTHNEICCLYHRSRYFVSCWKSTRKKLPKGAKKTEYKFGSLRRPLCPDKNDNFIANSPTNNRDIKENRWSSGNSLATLRPSLYDATKSCLSNWRPPTYATAKQDDWEIVERPLDPSDRVTWMLTCSQHADNCS